MRVRHESLKSEPINTHFGMLYLDEFGLITNLDDLDVPVEELLNVPGFVNAEVFPPPEGLPPEGEKKQKSIGLVNTTDTVTLKDEEQVTYTDDDYWGLIEGLLEEGAPVNGMGMIEMDFLNKNLTQRGVPTITGKRRKEITEKFTKKEVVENPDAVTVEVE